jgi:hypothetical protein
MNDTNTNTTEETPPTRTPKPRGQSGSQRTKDLGKVIGVAPIDLVWRMRNARCALCSEPLTFMRRYGEKKQYCAGCEPKLAPETRSALNELAQYL